MKNLLEQFENGQNNVIDVAEARRFGFLGVMQTASPVDRDIGQFLVQFHCASQRATSGDLTELVETFEHGTILAHID